MRKICTKYVSLNHGNELLKKAYSHTLPDNLNQNEIAFLWNPYSEQDQDLCFEEINKAVESGKVKPKNTIRMH